MQGGSWSGKLYSAYRVCLGVYLAIHFWALLPWGTEVFSGEGMLPNAQDSPLIIAFPNLLALVDSPITVQALLASLVGASILLAVGCGDRIAGLWVWYGLACLFGRNPLTANPSLPVVGWLLIVHTFVPPGPCWSLAGRLHPELAKRWKMPAFVPVAAWVVMSVSYSYSGWMKLTSPSWVDGSALAEVLANPLARPTGLRLAMLDAPAFLLQLATWSALALELLFAPLAIFKALRPFLWGAMLSMHCGLLVLVDFADLTAGMVLIHLLTADPQWFRRTAKSARQRNRVL